MQSEKLALNEVDEEMLTQSLGSSEFADVKRDRSGSKSRDKMSPIQIMP